MTQELSHELFTGHLNERFEVQRGDGPLKLELTEVDVGKAHGIDGLRQPLVLIFLGPRGRVLAEGMHRFENDRTGLIDLYAIPIVSAGTHQAYQVIFN